MSDCVWIRLMRKEIVFRCLLVAIACGLICNSSSAQLPRPLDAISAKLEPTRRLVYKTVGEQQLHLHLFEPEARQPHESRSRGESAADGRSVFLMIHGGGWTGGNARASYPLADHFARLGMVGISLEYRLARPDADITVFDCVKDGRSAVRYLRSHAEQLGIDPHRIVVAGGSAGGHIAAATALFDGLDDVGDDASISTRPDALILYYPVIDTSPQGYGQKKIGKRWRELSPVDHVKTGLPPTIIFHGTADRVTPYAGATRFHQRMKQADNWCELVSHDGGRHGYFIFDLKLYAEAMEQTQSFLETHRMIDR
jgi:acetyl esterase